MAASARILEDPWRVLLQSWPQNAAAFASFNAEEFTKKTCQNGSESTKIHQNGPKWRPSKKISPKDRTRAEKEPRTPFFWTPLGTQNQQKSEKKESRKSMIFSTPSWNRLCLILGSPRHPNSSQNEAKIDPRPAQTHFRPDCISCRPCQSKTHFCRPPNLQKS